MEKNLQPVRGMKDLIGEDDKKHAHIIKVASNIASNYCFEKITTPIVEYTNIFSRTLGDTSEVVNKEMYTFLDRGGDSLTLRPEFTAGIIRAFISNKMQHQLPLRLFSYGPVFRYDRPQAGRYRQFHQINFEYLGESDPYTDAESIRMALDIIEGLGIRNSVLHINSLGDKETRKNYNNILVEYFKKYEKDLSELSRIRLAKNPLRIFDSKEEIDKKLCTTAPLIKDYYSNTAREYFEIVLRYLDLLQVNYKIDYTLVRGLDYYSLTAFEFIVDTLGTQSTILAGGRYDSLCETMGGPYVPAIGFAAGIERLGLTMDVELNIKPFNIIIPIGNKAIEYSVNLVHQLRVQNHQFLLLKNGKVGKRMQEANKLGAKYVIIVGDDEIKLGQYKLKNMYTYEEKLVNLYDIYNLT